MRTTNFFKKTTRPDASYINSQILKAKQVFKNQCEVLERAGLANESIYLIES